MTTPTMELLQDHAARERIRTDLATNMLVEAGAGSGKTTSLVNRMLQHVLEGTPVERLAAVTFTRKAANELRERFQLRLELATREATEGSDEAERCARALREVDRAFLGTIHSFCSRLLRERPLEVELDPGFQEVTEDAWEDLTRRFWRRWTERARRANDDGLAALQEVGIHTGMLYESFKTVMTYPDVDFPLGSSAPPDTTSCRRELEQLLAEIRRAMPRQEPDAGWDPLMSLVRRLELSRGLGKLDDLAGFCEALETISTAACEITQKRWSGDPAGKRRAKELSESFLALLDGPIADVLRCWREHRYPIVMDVLLRATREFQQERHATGTLGFEDLLLLTARLLREHPAVRDELGSRYAHLLVDEFQDTDPIQAEVCFLLTSSSSEGDDWRQVTPRPGSLFVVGDPKQSIFRFRRADIQIYELVKRRMEAFGAVLPLTANFRSVSSIEAIVNGHFSQTFPGVATPQQAPYRPMQTRSEPAGADGVYTYVLPVRAVPSGPEIVGLDADTVASLIAERIATGERTPGQFMILTPRRAELAQYARALAERNVPVTTTGARLPQEHELRELLVVLRAIADPEDAIGVVAALEGLLFGLSPADLWTASQLGLRFAITHPPRDASDDTGRALAQLHQWWTCSQRHSADVLLEQILDDSGLLIHAAAQPLGDARAGALLHLVESLRAASTQGASALPDAMDRLETILCADAVDATLRPGRTDAVRVMNLHKAKGLEADVVFLAAPVDASVFEPGVHIVRGEAGQATGGLCLLFKDARVARVLAHPPHWAAMQDAEREFTEAEKARLLYVAVTRAKRELWVAQHEKMQKNGPKPDTSIWRPLAPVLEIHATPKALSPSPAPGRRVMEGTATSLHDATVAARARMEVAAVRSVRFVAVTDEARERDAEATSASPRSPTRGSGVAWGRAVHRSLEAMGRGRDGESLRAFVAAVARDESLDAEQAAALPGVVARVATSEAWRRLMSSGDLAFELAVMRRTEADGMEVVAEGVIDAAALGSDGWQILDWKTDTTDDVTWAARHDKYARQVATYVEMLASISGRPASGTVERVIT